MGISAAIRCHKLLSNPVLHLYIGERRRVRQCMGFGSPTEKKNCAGKNNQPQSCSSQICPTTTTLPAITYTNLPMTTSSYGKARDYFWYLTSI